MRGLGRDLHELHDTWDLRVALCRQIEPTERNSLAYDYLRQNVPEVEIRVRDIIERQLTEQLQ